MTSIVRQALAFVRAPFRRRDLSHLKGPRIRLVINALHAKTGGGVTYLRNLLPLLAKDDRFEIHLFLRKDQMDLFHPVDERVLVHAFAFQEGLLRLLLWEQLVLPAMARLVSADVVFSPANFGSLLIRDQVILLRNALAVARTETRFAKRLYWVVLGLVTFLSLVRIRRAIAVSDYAARSLSLGCVRAFAHKIRVIHHGIAPGFVPAEGERKGSYLLAVSDIYVQKNLHNLFRAMRIVCDAHPQMTLKVAGQLIDQWYYDKGIELARQLGVADRIEFLGRLPAAQLRPLYQDCLAFVFPSTAETFGMPLVEAMACGAPIACSNSTAMPEIIGDAALLFDPLDVEAMAAALLRIIADGDLRAALSERAVRRAAEFSWERTAERTAAVLAEASPRPYG